MGKIYFVEQASKVINYSIEPGALICNTSQEDIYELLSLFSQNSTKTCQGAFENGYLAFYKSLPDGFSADDLSGDLRAMYDFGYIHTEYLSRVLKGGMPQGISLVFQNSNTNFTLVVNFLNSYDIEVEEVPSDYSDSIVIEDNNHGDN